MIRGLLPLLISKDLDVNHPTSCCRAPGAGSAYCDSCDLFLGLDGLHVLAVERSPNLLTVTVESAPGPAGCPTCGVLAEAVGRRTVRLIDANSSPGAATRTPRWSVTVNRTSCAAEN